MKTITIDGEEYVLKRDVEKEMVEKGKTFEIVSKEMLVDEANVLGIGTVKIGEGYHAVKLSTEYLEKIIKGLKAISINQNGLDVIDIIWAKDYPCIIGRLGKDGTATGFILAPRYKSED